MSELQPEMLTDEQISFQIISHSGQARSHILESLRRYREGDVEGCRTLVSEASEMISKAHAVHFHLIQKDAQGEGRPLTLLLMHAEDHLMSTQTMRDLVQELIEIFEKGRKGGAD